MGKTVFKKDIQWVLAMNGETACAAGSYSLDSANTMVLGDLIRNAASTSCSGAGAAIVCHLLRNSKKENGEFNSPKLVPINRESNLNRYYESFGCTAPEAAVQKFFWTVTSTITGDRPLECIDPSPAKC